MTNRKAVVSIIAFVLVLTVCIAVSGSFFQPLFRDWGTYETGHSFYTEPKNTLEVIFLGPSTSLCGVSPTQLYRDYGICAYNLSGVQQPILCSYYWLQEAYRLHGETLKVVILDTSMLRKEPTENYYQRFFSQLRFSSEKYRAVCDYADSLNQRLEYLLPILSYHSRWSSLEEEDFEKNDVQPKTYLRGYYPRWDLTYIESVASDYTKYSLHNTYPDTNAGENAFNLRALEYLDRMVEFCEEKGIHLVLTRMPGSWSDADHNTTVALAQKYELEFYDFSFQPLLDELDYHFAVDNRDGNHPGITGSQKLTKWIGDYLSRSFSLTDVRGLESYAFLEDELVEYQNQVEAPYALQCQYSLREYLGHAIEMPGFDVFVAVKYDGGSLLSDEDRETFEQMGLPVLASLGEFDSYYAVINDGVIEENTAVWGESISDEAESDGKALSADGKLKNGVRYKVVSGGYYMGNNARIQIDGVEYASEKRGIHIAVYNHVTGEILSTVLFEVGGPTEISKTKDLRMDLERQLRQGVAYSKLPATLKKLANYERASENSIRLRALKESGTQMDMAAYLEALWGREQQSIFLYALPGADAILQESDRTLLNCLGLIQLSKLKSGESGIAVVQKDRVLFENIGENGELATVQGLNFHAVCEERPEETMLEIDGNRFRMPEGQFWIVVYDHVLETVIDQICIDSQGVAFRVEP